MELELETMRTLEPDIAACRKLFNELEFTTMLKELAPEAGPSQVEHLLDPDAAAWKRFAKAAKNGFAVAVDASLLATLTEQIAASETEAIEEEAPVLKSMSMMDMFEAGDVADPAAEPQQASGLTLAVAAIAGESLRVNLDGPYAEELRKLLNNAAVPKSVHDMKSSLRVLAPHGVTLAGVRDDIMLYSYLVNPTHTTHRLADVVARFTSRPLQETGDRQLTEAAHAIMLLGPLMREEVEALKTDGVYTTIDLPLTPLLLRMEEAGVRIDLKVLETMNSHLAAEMHRVGEEIFALAGHRFNINSPKQLGDVLFTKMNLPKPIKYGKGKVVSTAMDVLEDLAQHNPVPKMVLEYRQLAKLKSNYVDSLPLLADAEGRVHTTFNQVGTATGRLSSTNPNLQNIPIKTELGREIRAAFIAAPGNVMLSADYSQIELRLMAHFSEDPLLVHAYTHDEDIHTLTASEVFGIAPSAMTKEIRNRAKAVNFGIVYGISPFGLAAQLGIDQNEARLYIETYFARYTGVRTFIDRVLEETRATQSVRTLFGRVRPIPDIQSRNANLRGFAERTAVNTPLQGTAADLIKIAMLRIDERMSAARMKSRMTLQVHDELLFDTPKEEVEDIRNLVKHEMENVIELKVPIIADVGVGDNWRDMD